MSLFAARKLPKNRGNQLPDNDSIINTLTSSNPLKAMTMKKRKLPMDHLKVDGRDLGYTSKKRKLSPARDSDKSIVSLSASSSHADFGSTSMKRKLSPARDSDEPIFSLSASGSSRAVRGRNLEISDHSNASKKFAPNISSPRHMKHLPSVKVGNRGGYGTSIAIIKERIINLNPNIAQEDRDKVQELLKTFRNLYDKLWAQKGKGLLTNRIDREVVNILKKEGKWICWEKRFGHVPGIAIGDKFILRAELQFVGLHCQSISGIDLMKFGRKTYAISIVDSGRYDNKTLSEGVLIYSGQGWEEVSGGKADQKLRGGNLALSNNVGTKYPVRVIRKITRDNNDSVYVYDGLYLVKSSKEENDHKSRKSVFKFELHRMESQKRLSRQISAEFTKSSKGCSIQDDISNGKENFPVSVMNGLDCERPPCFTYITEMMYPEGFKLIRPNGCDCTDVCSKNLGKCSCKLKNGVVYECGPFCKCSSSSCKNRASQNGLRYKLELFKIGPEAWGVRSRGYISSGNFVCEFLGKLIPTSKNIHCGDSSRSKSENRDGNKSGFAIDAGKFGNVARFIRSSDSPNLSIRHVLYDHGDVRIPHVMFFATKNIPPSQELTCVFSHRMGETGQWRYRFDL